jgi:hypothetical protein
MTISPLTSCPITPEKLVDALILLVRPQLVALASRCDASDRPATKFQRTAHRYSGGDAGLMG